MAIPARALAGFSWTAGGQVASTVLTLAVSVALARLLTPHDFGIVAVATGLQIVLAALTDLGVTALVIRAELNPPELRRLFHIRLATGALQALLMVLGAPWLADAMAMPEIAPALRWLALGALLVALGNLPEALLRKQLRFRAVTSVALAAACASAAVGIGLALAGFGYWSLVAQSLAAVGTSAILHWLLAGWRPAAAAGAQADLGPHQAYVLNTWGLNILGALVWQADRLILGRLLGAAPLGLYMRGLGLAQQVQSLVSSAAEQVGFATLATLQQDGRQLRLAFLEMVALLASLLAPCMLVLSALAEPAILLLFGPAWNEAHDVLRWVAAGLLLNGLTLTWDWLLRAIGRADALFRWALFDGTLRVAALAAGAWAGGAQGAALAYLGAAAPLFAVRAWWMARVAGVPLRDYCAAWAKPVGSGLVAAGAAALAAAAADAVLLRLVLGALAAAGAYTLLALLFGNALLARLGWGRA